MIKSNKVFIINSNSQVFEKNIDDYHVFSDAECTTLITSEFCDSPVIVEITDYNYFIDVKKSFTGYIRRYDTESSQSFGADGVKYEFESKHNNVFQLDDVNENIPVNDSYLKFDKLTSTWNSLPGIPEGDIIPLFTMSVTGSKTSEVNSTQSVTITISYNRKPNSIEIDTLNIFEPEFTGNILDGGVIGDTQTRIQYTGLTANKTWSIKAYGDDGTNITKSISITFVAPFLYGVNSDPALNGSASIGIYPILTKSISSKSNKTYTMNATDEYIYFCYPASYGNLTSIKNPSNLELIGAFTKTVITELTNNISYNIYRSGNKLTVNGSYQFKF